MSLQPNPRRILTGVIVAVSLIIALPGCAPAVVSPMSSPAATSVDDVTSEALVLGDAPHYLIAPDGSARVTVVEFVDFQCPPCSLVAPVLSELAQEYQGSVSFAVRNYPLSMHDNAMDAAIAMEAAAEQGAFKEMYNALFDQQTLWAGRDASAAHAAFRSIAESLGIDLDAWDVAVGGDAARARVEDDIEAGNALGIQGTPAVFVNGSLIALSSLEDLREAIKAATEASS